jgi:hypothetical protein
MSGRARTARKGPPAIKSADRKAALQAHSGVERKRAVLPVQADYPIGKNRKLQKGISIYMHPLAKDVLDAIADEHGKKIQDLGLEALNLLFKHYGKKPIA